jgi:hypothetical protein
MGVKTDFVAKNQAAKTVHTVRHNDDNKNRPPLNDNLERFWPCPAWRLVKHAEVFGLNPDPLLSVFDVIEKQLAERHY